MSDGDLERVTSQVRGWEVEGPHRDDAWLWRQYDSLEVPETFVEHVRRKLLRADTDVYLAAARAPITFRSAVLNRLWVALLVKHDGSTTWVPSATTKVTKQGIGSVVTFADEAAAAGHDARFRRVILRHGPSHALTGALQWIHSRCESLFRARNALDETRWPIWKENETFGTHGAASRPGGPELMPRAAVVGGVERGVDTTAGSVAGGATTRYSAGFGVSPFQMLDLRPEGAAPIHEAPHVPVGGFISFVGACRVDLESVGAAARRSGTPSPVLRWHPSIQRPLDRIMQGAGMIDSVRELAGSAGDDERHLNVPAFKQSFFDEWERLRAAQREIQQGFDALWSFLGDAAVASRAAAVRTFASLAALRMIARLGAFEGMLHTDSGQLIVNLFPHLPPITSSWLLRRVPYRSRVGALALGEERFLLCRISEHAQDYRYRYLLLPRHVAELAQGRSDGLPGVVLAQWIIPQWFFQRYAGTPSAPQIVGTLVDEYGRERHASDRPAPWHGDEELEEKAHPALSHGAKLHELEPGWDVLVVPPDPRPGAPFAARPPLAGKRILWVDDNPSNNQFEISYLEQLGSTVSYATTTELALAEIAKYKPDLVISDITRVEHGKRIGGAGLELIRQMEARIAEGTAMPPVIFYTGSQQHAPEAIREISADRAPTLFALIDARLGVRA